MLWRARVILRRAGDYLFQLTVRSGAQDSLPDLVEVSVRNVPPSAAVDAPLRVETLPEGTPRKIYTLIGQVGQEIALQAQATTPTAISCSRGSSTAQRVPARSPPSRDQKIPKKPKLALLPPKRAFTASNCASKISPHKANPRSKTPPPSKPLSMILRLLLCMFRWLCCLLPNKAQSTRPSVWMLLVRSLPLERSSPTDGDC